MGERRKKHPKNVNTANEVITVTTKDDYKNNNNKKSGQATKQPLLVCANILISFFHSEGSGGEIAEGNGLTMVPKHWRRRRPFSIQQGWLGSDGHCLPVVRALC